MKILYDYQAFSLQKYGGVSNCFVQLISNLPSDIKYELGFKYTENYHLLNSKLHYKNTWVIKEQSYPLYSNIGYNFLQNKFPFLFHTPYNMTLYYSLKLIEKGKYDILHATFFDPYFLKKNIRPYVITIHDLIPEIYGFEQRQVEGRRILIENASKIITVSEYSKNDIIRILKVPEDKISVIYHGYEPTCNLTLLPMFERPYILYVGARWSYKRFDYFLKESAKFLHEHNDFIIVCTGDNFNSQEIKLIKDLNIQNRIFHKFCSTEELASLYKYAFAFVYPSEYEGFGIPILDAFYAECPVILNRKSCFPEVAKNAALYFDSESKCDTLYRQLKLLYNMNSVDRDLLKLKAKERLSFFSWKTSALKLADVYRQIIK